MQSVRPADLGLAGDNPTLHLTTADKGFATLI